MAAPADPRILWGGGARGGAAGARRVGGRAPAAARGGGRWAATRSFAGWAARNGLQVRRLACASTRAQRRPRRRRRPRRPPRRPAGAAGGRAADRLVQAKVGREQAPREAAAAVEEEDLAGAAIDEDDPGRPSPAPGRRLRLSRRDAAGVAHGAGVDVRADGAERLNVYVGEWATGASTASAASCAGWRRAGRRRRWRAAVPRRLAAGGGHGAGACRRWRRVLHRGEWLGEAARRGECVLDPRARRRDVRRILGGGRARRVWVLVRADGERYEGEWGGGERRRPQCRGRRQHMRRRGGQRDGAGT